MVLQDSSLLTSKSLGYMLSFLFGQNDAVELFVDNMVLREKASQC
jgi:hypothetical protein